MKYTLLNRDSLELLPMSAEEIAKGGAYLQIAYTFEETLFGELLIASTCKGICYLAFVTEGQEEVLAELKQLFPAATYEHRSDVFQQQLLAALKGESVEKISLHLKGTEFQWSVWKELLNIPFGQTTSYGEIARSVQKPKASRAVGTAIGANPVSILIPCHRVLRTDGALGGYHWGLERKVRLLEWERKLVDNEGN